MSGITPPWYITPYDAEPMNKPVEDDLDELRKRLYNIWKATEQTHVDPQHRIVKIRRQVPKALSRYNPPKLSDET